MKTRLEWQEEAAGFKGYAFEDILEVCKSVEDSIVEGYENGLFEEKKTPRNTQKDFGKRLRTKQRGVFYND